MLPRLKQGRLGLEKVSRSAVRKIKGIQPLLYKEVLVRFKYLEDTHTFIADTVKVKKQLLFTGFYNTKSRG